MENNALQVDYTNWEAGKQHTDFFANRVTNYSKGVQNWDANDIF